MAEVQEKTRKQPRTPREANLERPRLPRWAPAAVAVLAVVVGYLSTLALHFSIAGGVVVAAIVFLLVLPGWSRAVEGRRAAADRTATALVWVAFGIAMVPLVSLLFTVISKGAPQVNGKFLTFSMRNIVGEPGGIYHAIIGTLLITLAATLISVPIGLLTSIYLVEYGGKNRLAAAIRFLVDVMTGIPSIVAGLFAYAVFSLILGPGIHLGIGGSVALSLLMIPIVVRSAEEMLKLVPGELREASYALGVPKWRTIVKIVLPTASAGIITGVTLAIARVIGETAPLLIIAGSTDSVNSNLFNGSMQTLPVFIFYSYTQVSNNPDILRNMAWGGAFVLVLIVLLLNLLARIAGRLLAPKKGH